VTHSGILNKLASTVIRLTIQESFSGKVTIRESSFRETSRPGKNIRETISGKRLSGKMTIRESYYPGNDCKPISALVYQCFKIIEGSEAFQQHQMTEKQDYWHFEEIHMVAVANSFLQKW